MSPPDFLSSELATAPVLMEPHVEDLADVDRFMYSAGS